MGTFPLSRPIALGALLLLARSTADAQGLQPTLTVGGGPNVLLAAGADIDARTGLSNYIGAHLTLGRSEAMLSVRPGLQYAWGRYRTRVTDLVDHLATRSALQLDVLAAIRAGEYGAWLAGPFVGAVLSSGYTMRERGTAQASAPLGQQYGSMATSMQLGVVLGYSVQLGTSGKWDMDLRLRQHLSPLLVNDHWYTVPNGPQELLLTTTARPLDVTIGLGWRIG